MIQNQKHNDILIIETSLLKANKNLPDILVNEIGTKIILYGENTVIGNLIAEEGEIICLD